MGNSLVIGTVCKVLQYSIICFTGTLDHFSRRAWTTRALTVVFLIYDQNFKNSSYSWSMIPKRKKIVLLSYSLFRQTRMNGEDKDVELFRKVISTPKLLLKCMRDKEEWRREE